MISNQDPLRYGTALKLVLIITLDGARSSVLTSYFKMNECGNCKLEKEHHSGERYLSLLDLMGNASFHISLFTKPRSTPKISTIIYNFNG